ncbi:SH2 domain-containing protein 2A isoform X3 [Phyllostomus discolor]|uniref:SH2 domain-containing protein 2A isoform X3 n=1 Tax=Phyllostomus discolor TaxID=89673 RepID=A0A7E6CY49_9CHIR|nr:SH2 domain-containing protein 2A isoform X3 [Phyllostomus discolor]
MDLTYKSCQGLGLLPVPRFQALKAEEAQFIPTAPDVHAGASSQALGAAPSPEDTGRAEEVPREGGQSLQAETRAWFQKTQAQGLLQHGAAPPWFHGFITRREAERLLETKPEGCYLVRFSESAVTFVLTYRSRTCCRHFLLAQLGDGRHMVLGEDSAHWRLQDLLRHYTGSPLSPYGETLSQPLAREPPRPKPPVPAKPQLPPEVYTSSTPRPRPAVPPKPSNPIYHEPDEPIAFYAMGRGSPGEAPSNIYAEVEAAVPSGSKGPPCILQHPVLWKCRSRPVPGSQFQAPSGHLLAELFQELPNSSLTTRPATSDPLCPKEARMVFLKQLPGPIQVAGNCVLKILWLNKALSCPTSPCLSGDTASLIPFLDRCFRTEDRRVSPWGLLSSR